MMDFALALSILLLITGTVGSLIVIFWTHRSNKKTTGTTDVRGTGSGEQRCVNAGDESPCHIWVDACGVSLSLIVTGGNRSAISSRDNESAVIHVCCEHCSQRRHKN